MAEVNLRKTGERIVPEKIKSCDEYLLYLRHMFAYKQASHFLNNNNNVLEVGCGEGYGTHYLSHRVKNIIGLDIDENTIKHAAAKYSSDNCTFNFFDGLNIPYEDNIFDVVISFQVIEHVFNDFDFVSDIYRVMKKNSNFILTTPNRKYRLKNNQQPWNRFHVREYSAIDLNNLLNRTFNSVNIWGIRGNDDIQKNEIKRVKQILKIQSFDPLNLRRCIPGRYQPIIITLLKKIINRNNNIEGDFQKQIYCR